MFKRFGPAAALAAISALALMPAIAQAKTQTASAKGVKATFTYKGQPPNITSTLKITRNGKLVYSHAVTDPSCGKLCGPGAYKSKSVHVLDLDHNGKVEVLLDLFSGGANCCFAAQVFTYDAAHKTYRKVSYDAQSAGYRLVVTKHGPDEFITRDNVFDYAFASHASSGMPVELLVFRSGHFVNVTRSFRKLIAGDAAQWLKVFKSDYKLKLGNGAIAAWAADEELLGQSKLVTSYLAAQQKAGHLKSSDPTWPSGKAFIKALMKLLKANGYIH